MSSSIAAVTPRHRELCRPIQEPTAIDLPVNVAVEQVQQFLIEIVGFLLIHDRLAMGAECNHAETCRVRGPLSP